MPPKKRFPKEREQEYMTETPAVPSTVTTPRGKVIDTTAAASRPKRTITTTMPAPDPPAKYTRVGSSASSVSGTPRPTGTRQSARLATPLASSSSSTSTSTTAKKSSTVAKKPAAAKKRGRPAGTTAAAAAGKKKKLLQSVNPRLNSSKANEHDNYNQQDDDNDDANITEATTIIQSNTTTHSDNNPPSYWLMKAEPDTRMENNSHGQPINVKFTIDDLRSRTTPEPWEGIRNPQAQKNIKAMKPGDLAFFYESNCKKPGLVGVMEIVSFPCVDTFAFDQNSVYYDAKSDLDNPKWMMVHVEFRRKFGQKLTLKELQKFSQKGGRLEGMQVFRQSRLSVSAVSRQEWDFIMSLVGEDDDEEEEQVDPDTEMGVAEDDDDAEPDTEMAAPTSTINKNNTNQDMGNDFAAAFEAPANFGLSKPKPIPSSRAPVQDRSVSRGRRSQQKKTASSSWSSSLPPPSLPVLHDAVLKARHEIDGPFE